MEDHGIATQEVITTASVTASPEEAKPFVRGGQQGFGGQRGGPRNDRREEKPDDGIKEVVISVNRVSRTMKGGRRMSFQALMVVGDGANKVGMGIGKAGDVQSAVAKASRRARRAMKTIAINKNKSIAHVTSAKKDGVLVLLKPAALGTGLIAGGTTRAVLSVTGIANIVAKSQGSNNKANNALATIEALTKVEAHSKWVTAGRAKASEKREVKTEAVLPENKPEIKGEK